MKRIDYDVGIYLDEVVVGAKFSFDLDLTRKEAEELDLRLRESFETALFPFLRERNVTHGREIRGQPAGSRARHAARPAYG